MLCLPEPQSAWFRPPSSRPRLSIWTVAEPVLLNTCPGGYHAATSCLLLVGPTVCHHVPSLTLSSRCSVLYLIPHVQALSVTLSLQTSPAYIKGERYIVSWNVEMETNEDRGSGSLFIVKQRGSGQLSDDPLEASFNESLTGEGSFAFGGTGYVTSQHYAPYAHLVLVHTNWSPIAIAWGICTSAPQRTTLPHIPHPQIIR